SEGTDQEDHKRDPNSASLRHGVRYIPVLPIVLSGTGIAIKTTRTPQPINCANSDPCALFEPYVAKPSPVWLRLCRAMIAAGQQDVEPAQRQMPGARVRTETGADKLRPYGEKP